MTALAKGFAVLGLGLCLSITAMAQESAPPAGCPQAALRVVVHNLSLDPQAGYLMGDAAAPFHLSGKESTIITMTLRRSAQEHRLQAFFPEEASPDMAETMDLTASNQCAGYVELPATCPSTVPAAHLYVYKTARGSQCFVRSVAHLPRTRDAALALKK